VTWTLDGAAPRRDEGGRDQLLAPSTMYAAGRHVVGVRIQPVGGGPASRPSCRVTATDCQLASLSQRPDLRGGGLEVAVASGGPPLRAIELRPGSGRFAGARGGRLGTVGLSGGRTRALRASALSRGRARSLAQTRTDDGVRLAPGGRARAAARSPRGFAPPPAARPRCAVQRC
jgi:hypothetical protein